MISKARLQRCRWSVPALRLIAIISALSVAVVAVRAQSPQPLPGNELRGALLQEQRLQQLYSFDAGPGEGIVTVEVKTSGTGSQLEVSIIDQASITLLRLLTTSNQGKRSESIRLPSRQRLTLKLSGPGSNHNGSYALILKGRAFENLGKQEGDPIPHPSGPRDTTGPRIKIISPQVSRGQGESRADKITVICEVTDESGVKEVLIQGQPARLRGGDEFYADISLKPGENEILVTATDGKSNLTPERFTIRRDPILVTGPTDPAPAGEGAYHALIIAVQNYQHPSVNSLDFPIGDARKVKQTLVEHYTFEPGNVVLLENPDRDKIISSLDELAGKLRAEDNLLIFYAGHGHWDEKREQGYWLPNDSRRETRSKWISNSDLRDAIRGINAQHILLVSDACFSGGLLVTREAFAKTPAIEEMLKLKSRTAMTSGALTTVPDRSVFVKHMLDYLEKNADPYLLASDLLNRIRAPVINNSPKQSDGNRPTPRYGTIAETDDRGGDFVFVRRPNGGKPTNK